MNTYRKHRLDHLLLCEHGYASTVQSLMEGGSSKLFESLPSSGFPAVDIVLARARGDDAAVAEYSQPMATYPTSPDDPPAPMYDAQHDVADRSSEEQGTYTFVEPNHHNTRPPSSADEWE